MLILTSLTHSQALCWKHSNIYFHSNKYPHTKKTYEKFLKLKISVINVNPVCENKTKSKVSKEKLKGQKFGSINTWTRANHGPALCKKCL